MPRMLIRTLAGVCALSVAAATADAQPGKASGSFSYDTATVPLAYAVEARVENLFDSSKTDTLVVLSDRSLGATAPGDDIELSLKARNGEIAALALRVDGGKLVNVSVFHKGLSGKVLLPGAWFQYTPVKPNVGSLKLAAREFDGHKYACAVDFAAAAAPKPTAAEPPPPSKPSQPAPQKASPPPPLPPATTSNIDPKAATALLVQAIMGKDEHRALEIIKLGADPNGRDQYGMPVLNWAVMMCQPQVVKALVDRKADLTYQRAPGMTILTEAGACPEAAKILRAAGAK